MHAALRTVPGAVNIQNVSTVYYSRTFTIPLPKCTFPPQVGKDISCLLYVTFTLTIHLVS